MSSPSRNCTSPFSGVVILSFVVAGLQNSLLMRVECTFSTIGTCVNLPAFTFRYKGVLQGHLLFCCSFLHFLTGFGTFLITEYLFCDLLFGSVFSVSKLIEIVILWVYYTIPFGFSLFRHFRVIIFKF